MSAWAVAGSFGLGMVWGWLAARVFDVRPLRPSSVILVGALSLQGVEALWLTGARSVPALAGGWSLGLLVHLTFRTALRMRSSQRTTS